MMLFERNNSRIYYPIFLNELLDLRAYHSDGSINEDRARKPKNQVQVSMAGQEAIFSNIEEIDEAPISSSWVVMVALEALKWAYRWAEYGSDLRTSEHEQWWLQQLRCRKHFNIPAFVRFFNAAAWKMALRMREGETFETASTELEADDDKWVKAEIERITGQMASKPKAPPSKRGSSGERRRSRGRDSSPKGRGRNQQKDLSPGGRDLCRNFNGGSCNRADTKREKAAISRGKRACLFAHMCSNCRTIGCFGASKCTRPKKDNRGGKRHR